MQIYGTKESIQELLYYVCKGMLEDRDPMGCGPACRLENEDKYDNCQECIRDNFEDIFDINFNLECFATLGTGHYFTKEQFPHDKKINMIEMLDEIKENL